MNALTVCVTDEENEEILETEEAALRLFITESRDLLRPAQEEESENVVFRHASKDPVIQKHLGLEMAQSIFGQ